MVGFLLSLIERNTDYLRSWVDDNYAGRVRISNEGQEGNKPK
jgi:hypothetical protein